MAEIKSASIPYFVRMGGCINCDVSQQCKRMTGKDYGFHHELLVACLLRECYEHGHAIYNPFIDPAEIVRFAREENLDRERARKICLQVKERFGEAYASLGVSIDEILEGL